MLRVKSLCKRKGITLKELAEEIGLSQAAVSRMLKDDGNPRLSNLKKIAEVLDVQLSELFDDYNEEMRVHGFIEVNKEVHKIRSFNELQRLCEILKSNSTFEGTSR